MRTQNWLIHHGSDATHVLPINDLKSHYTNIKCWCHPEDHVDTDDDVIVHNSMDGRERFEQGFRKVS